MHRALTMCGLHFLSKSDASWRMAATSDVTCRWEDYNLESSISVTIGVRWWKPMPLESWSCWANSHVLWTRTISPCPSPAFASTTASLTASISLRRRPHNYCLPFSRRAVSRLGVATSSSRRRQHHHQPQQQHGRALVAGGAGQDVGVAATLFAAYARSEPPDWGRTQSDRRCSSTSTRRRRAWTGGHQVSWMFCSICSSPRPHTFWCL